MTIDIIKNLLELMFPNMSILKSIISHDSTQNQRSKYPEKIKVNSQRVVIHVYSNKHYTNHFRKQNIADSRGSSATPESHMVGLRLISLAHFQYNTFFILYFTHRRCQNGSRRAVYTISDHPQPRGDSNLLWCSSSPKQTKI